MTIVRLSNICECRYSSTPSKLRPFRQPVAPRQSSTRSGKRLRLSFGASVSEQREEEEEEEEEKREKEEPVAAAEAAPEKSSEKPSTPSGASPLPEKSEQASAEVKGAAEPDVAPLKKDDVKREGETETAEEQSSDSADDGSDANDREDELDEAEEANGISLQNLLTTARDISVFMPEELVTERVQRIMEWAR